MFPFHKDCLEGMASGPAINARWGKEAGELSENSLALEIEAYYLVQAIFTALPLVPPEKTNLDGGVMEQRKRLPLIAIKLSEILAGYVSLPLFETALSTFVVNSGLGKNAGIIGALALALKQTGLE
jgi:fructokinase